MISIAICDDEMLYIKELKKAVESYNKWLNHSYKIHIFTSGMQVLDATKDGLKLDILFIDIKLDDSSLGTDVGVRLKTMNPDVLIIYVSAYELYYKELVSAEPFDFIRKPVSTDRISKVLDKAIMRLAYIRHEFVYQYKFNGITYRVDLNNVLYFESRHRIINICCTDGTTQQFYEKLDNVEKEIDEIYPCFLRVNKSYYVNFNYIVKVSSTTVIVRDIEMRLGRQYKQRFNEKYDKIILSWYA